MDPELIDRLEAASATFASAIHDATPGRIDHLDDEMATYLTALRDAASAARSAIETTSDAKAAAARAEAAAALSEISDTASRILTSFAPAIPDRTDVVWLDHEDNRGSPRAVLRVAPLSVAGLAAQPGVLTFDDGADVGDADDRRILRRDGRRVGADRTGRTPITRRGVVSTSDRRSTTPRPESCTWPPTFRRRAATAPARPSS